jgi:molybdopterin-containing oxidoreductase family iron-sulfur binding subunit
LLDVPSMTDIGALRARVQGTRGRAFWRSLDEIVETPEFLEFLQHEFPRQAAGIVEALDRRGFLKLMGASFALAGLGACTNQPEERVVPYVRQPEGLVLGEPRYYATAMPLHGFGIGVLAESHEGRPTKIEGNPEHPASLGAADALTQASVLGLYDPDRSQTVESAGEIRTWDGFLAAVRPALDAQEPKHGAGLRILTETITSPTLARQIRALLTRFPQARWIQYDADGRDNVREGTRRAFGAMLEPQHRLADAKVVVTLDADLFGRGPARLHHIRDWSRARKIEGPQSTPLRLYAIEATPTTVGAVADHRLPLRASDVEAFARRLAVRAGVQLAHEPGADTSHDAAHAQAFLDTLARDLTAHRGHGLIVAGDDQPPAVHALAHATNVALGNVGRTVTYVGPVEAQPQLQLAALRELTDDMAAGHVELLLVLGVNPVLTAPADLEFAARLMQVPLRVHLGAYADETARISHWHVPEAHYLESWGDVRAYDGTATLVQPLIAPLYGGKTASEFLAALVESPERNAYDVLRATWRGLHGARHDGSDFETFWKQSLHDGVVAGSALPPARVALSADWDVASAPVAEEAGVEVVLRPDPYIDDGRFANNGWLQELPRPITKLVWDNAALVAPATAERLELANGDVVELGRQGRMVRTPVWIVPGHAAESLTLTFGFGRTGAGRVATGAGVDVLPLRTSTEPAVVRGVAVRKTGDRVALATTQDHHSMEGRPIVRTATLDEYRRRPDFAQHEEHVPSRDETLYPNREYTGYAWGMTIDLGACIGCNACEAACVAENNIAVVGKDQVLRGREMHWIRVDRYWTGDLDNPATVHQPVPCMQCENAPCEVVCPVAATNHSSEGLNDMVYNRCVGTRYCSNNCPYKVRRFNYYLYSDWTDETLKMVRNPDVTVRSRGVMEKCTYCVQRIEHARAHAITQGRTIRDGEITTACQQACPAEAIVFGDVNDPASRVSQTKRDPRNYALLAELNTRPRTTYLAQVRNPNPELEKPGT